MSSTDVNNKIKNATDNYNRKVTYITNYYNSIIGRYLNMRMNATSRNNIIQNLKKQHADMLNLYKKELDDAVNKIKKNALDQQTKINATNNTNSVISINTTKPTNKKALLFGLNYNNSAYALKGCINDAKNMSSFLDSLGFISKTITDDTAIKPTRNNIINEITSLLKDSNENDVLFITFSGHGSYILDTNYDERTGYDQVLVSSDLKYIVDDELKNIIQDNLKKNVKLFCLFDCCFSGSALDLKYQHLDTLGKTKLSVNVSSAETESQVIMISGCSDIQTSADATINGVNQGAMTWSFLETFKANKDQTWNSLLSKMREMLVSNKYTQIPQLSSGNLLNLDDKVML